MTTNQAGRTCVLLLAATLTAQPVMAQELIRTRPAAPAPAPATPKPATAAPPAAAASTVAAPPLASAVSNTPVTAFDELPQGAPADDYEFMGWCTGVLTGHMQLYFRVKPELDAISKRWNSLESDNRQQTEQQTAGKELLTQFRHAMGTVEAASPSPISFRGQTAVQKGLATWTSVDQLDKQNQAYSWMNFGLPGRCETKAAEIEKSGGKIKPVALSTPAPALPPMTGVTTGSASALLTPASTPTPKPATPAAAKPAAPKPAAPAVKAADRTPTAKEAGLRR